MKSFSNILFAARGSSLPEMTGDGVQLIEAAGDAGEARLVARHAKTWLNDGITPGQIVVTGRDLDLPLLREVFDDYSIPATWPVEEPLAQCGAVAALLRAWSVPLRGFRYRDVAALLRNHYFRPEGFESELPRKAEMLLRELGVTRGRDAFLTQVQRTAEDKAPLPLEDESMEQSHRDHMSRTAKRCLGFVQWFFALWDSIPPQATKSVYAVALQQLAQALGIGRDPQPLKDDPSALEAFWNAVTELPEERWSTGEFLTQLNALTAITPWPKARVADGVRVIPAEIAAGAACSHMILTGLVEGSFPRAAVELTDETLAQEKALFAQLLDTPSQALVLSRAAINAKGQALLPSSFLEQITTAIPALPVTKQTMPLDGYFTAPALSAAERRAQFANRGGTQELPDSVRTGLAAALRMKQMRFDAKTANSYSGRLSTPAIVKIVADQFGARKLFSASSLEMYVACPFRFWLEKVLGLAAIEDPTEDVTAGARGTAIHRALARFHGNSPVYEHYPEELARHWSLAVEESVERAPGSVQQMIWTLERRRVQRALNRYPEHWQKHTAGWTQRGIPPVPTKLEAMFGYTSKTDAKPALAIQIKDVEVRLGGVIDRVDLAELDDGYGFWIIDYKTGRGTQYTSTTVLDFESLQLPLYALAVERVFQDGKSMRPLGLAYWLIADNGPKRMLPKKELEWFEDVDAWPVFREQVVNVVANIVSSIRQGDFRLAPRNEKVCEYCVVSTICRINQHRDRYLPLNLVE